LLAEGSLLLFGKESGNAILYFRKLKYIGERGKAKTGRAMQTILSEALGMERGT